MVLKAHRDRIKQTRIFGPPDLVVEVASPATTLYDRRKKCDAYAQAGVPEYWIVDPAACTVEILILENGAYRLIGFFEGEETLVSLVVPEMAAVQVKQFFATMM